MKKKEGRSPVLFKALHRELASSYLWYKKWHNWYGSTIVHTAVVLLITAVAISSLAAALRPHNANADTKTWNTQSDWNTWTLDDTQKFGNVIRLDLVQTLAGATKGATLPTSRSDVAAAWNPNDNKFYIFGGNLTTPAFTTQNQSDEIVVYDPVADSIATKSATLPQDLSGSSAIWSPTQNKFYIFGGVHANQPVSDTPQPPSAQKKVMEYDPVTDVLVEKTAQLPSDITVGLGVTWSTTTNKAYVIGGSSIAGAGSVSTILEYDPAADSLTTKSAAINSPNGIAYGVTVWDSVNNKIYIIGGYTQNAGWRMVGNIFEYDPSADSITLKAGAILPTSPSGTSLYPYRLPSTGYYNTTEEKIYLGSVMEGDTSQTNLILSYTPTTNTVATESQTLPMIIRNSVAAYSTTSNLGFFFGGVSGYGSSVPYVNTIIQPAQNSYVSPGTATYVYTPSAGTTQDWQSATINATLNGQSVTAQYTNNTDCTTGLVSNLALVPNSESLCIKLTLSTTNPYISPKVTGVTLTYEPVVAEDPTPSPSPVEASPSPDPDPVDDPSPSPDPIVTPSPSPIVVDDNPPTDDGNDDVVDDTNPPASPSPSPSPIVKESPTPSPSPVSACLDTITNLGVATTSSVANVSFKTATAQTATIYLYIQSKASGTNKKATNYKQNSTSLEESGASATHNIGLGDLQQNTTYYYTLLLGSNQDCEHSFKTQAVVAVATPSPSPSPIVFVTTSPTGSGTVTRRSPRPGGGSNEATSSTPLQPAPSLFVDNLPPEAELILGVTTRAALGASAVAAVVPLIAQAALNSLQLLPNIPNFFTSLWLHFLQLLSRNKKRRPWGVVKDSFSGEGLANAIVYLILIASDNSRKVLEQTVTDKDGRFGFLAGTGSYQVVPKLVNYAFPSKTLPKSYQGTPFHIEESQPITLTLYMDRLIKRTNWSFIFKKLVVFLEKFRLPLLILGTCIAIFNYLNYPYVQLNWIFLILYMVLWILELVNLRKTRNTILFVDEKDNPLPFTLVRFVHQKSAKVMATKVTDKVGEVYVLIPAGKYTVIIPSPRNPQGTQYEIDLPQGVAPKQMKIKVQY